MEGSSGSETTRKRKLNNFDNRNKSDEAEIYEARDLEKERRDVNKATNTKNMDWSSCGRLLRMVIYVMVIAVGIGATYAYVPWKIALAVIICLLIFLLGFYLGLIHMVTRMFLN